MKDQIHVSQGIVRPRNEICGTGSGFRKIDEYSKMLMILEYCSVILYKESTLSLFVIWVDWGTQAEHGQWKNLGYSE